MHEFSSVDYNDPNSLKSSSRGSWASKKEAEFDHKKWVREKAGVQNASTCFVLEQGRPTGQRT
jgi:hypothetical protein